MGPILVVLTFFLMVFGSVAGTIFLFRWLMMKYTGYDASPHIEAHHQYLKREVDFALLRDWDHETGFSETHSKSRKKRKAKDTPHYDRLYAMDKAQEASARLQETHSDDSNADPVPLRTLVERKK